VECDDGAKLTSEQRDMRGLPVRAQSDLLSIEGNLVPAGTVGRVLWYVYDGNTFTHVDIEWPEYGRQSHPPVLDNFVIHRH
jgi:hypothetical protein